MKKEPYALKLYLNKGTCSVMIIFDLDFVVGDLNSDWRMEWDRLG